MKSEYIYIPPWVKQVKPDSYFTVKDLCSITKRSETWVVKHFKSIEEKACEISFHPNRKNIYKAINVVKTIHQYNSTKRGEPK